MEKADTSTQLLIFKELQTVIARGVHECNNHLAVILTNCDMIQLINTPENTNQKIESIQKRVSLISQILRALSSFSRIEYNKNLETINAKLLLDRVISNLNSSLVDAKIEISVDVSSDLNLATVPEIFEQMIRFLVQNSIDSVNETNVKKINIAAQADKKNIYFKVSDSGQLVEADVAEKMFKPFFTTKDSHLGQGLTLASTYAKLMGGEIKFTQNQEKNCMSVCLPERMEG